MLNREGPGGDDIISLLEHRDHTVGIDLLSHSCWANVLVITDTFLGGSAPRL